MLKVLAILIPLVALGALAPAGAKPSDDVPGLAACEPSTSQATVDLGDRYVVVDLSGVYLYEETGALPSLQRDDAGKDDTCKGKIKPDLQLL